MPENNNEIEPRVAVLEADMKTVKNATAKQWSKLDGIQEDIGEVKEHLARQNGAIPHMKDKLDEVAHMCTLLMEEQHADDVEQAKISTRTKIYLGIAALGGAAIIGAVVKAWFPIFLKALIGLSLVL